MSRFLCITSICLLAAISVASPADAQLQKGLFAGWNQTTWTGEVPGLSGETYEPKTGYCFGAFLGDTLSGNFGWRTEILYSRKGAKTVQVGTDENGSATGDVDYFFNVDYLEIPVLLTFTIPTGGKFAPVLYLGPAIDFELSSKLDAQYPSGVKYAYADGSELAETGSPDFSMIFAGGVDIDAGTTVVNVQVRYVVGLTEVYETAKNRAFTIMAGIGF